MKIRMIWGALAFLICLQCACRSEFEKTRLSNDPNEIYTAANKYYDKGEYLRALTLYELILSQFRGRPEAEDLYFRYAYTQYYLKQYTLAAHYFTTFSNTFAYSEKREEADYMAAYSKYQMSPGFRLEQSETVDAIQGFQDFVNRYPNSTRVPECNALIDEMRAKLEDKAFASAELYFNIGEYEAAIHSYENTLKDFPDTKRAELIRFKIVKGAYLFAQKSIYERRQERYEDAIERYNEFVRKYPRSAYLAEAKSIYQQCQEQLKNLNQ